MNTRPFLGEDDESEQLVLKSLHRHGEVDDGGLGADLRRVGRVAELRRQVQPEAGNHVHLLLADLHLVHAAGLDEVLLQQIVQRRVELLADVLDQQRMSHRQRVFQMCPELLVVQIRYLRVDRNKIRCEKTSTVLRFFVSQIFNEV